MNITKKFSCHLIVRLGIYFTLSMMNSLQPLDTFTAKDRKLRFFNFKTYLIFKDNKLKFWDKAHILISN